MKTVLALVLTAMRCFGQPAPDGGSLLQDRFTKLLSFEDSHSANVLNSWVSIPQSTVAADNRIVHSGKWAARIERTSASPLPLSRLLYTTILSFKAQRIELRGWLRTDNVNGFVGLWLRENGQAPNGQTRELASEDMRSQRVEGTTGWKEYSISLPVDSPVQREVRVLYFGVVLSGTGKAWADDLQLLVDGKPLWEVAETRTATKPGAAALAPKLTLDELTSVQIENLVLFGKIWGFLKYHHPRIIAGELNWDDELLREAPAILAAPDALAARKAIREWIARLGTGSPCTSCATQKENDVHLRPDLRWLADTTLLGEELSAMLRAIYRNRPVVDQQFYVRLTPNVGNPAFQNESNYAGLSLPDAGYQLLAVYRFWNVIEYWFPYKDLIGADWNEVLREFIPKVALAKSSDQYQRELMALIARVNDTHANLWSSLKARPPVGACVAPAAFRFVGDQILVTALRTGQDDTKASLQIGDVLEALDGTAVSELVAAWRPYYAASNEAARRRDIARFLTRGDCVDVALTVRRRGAQVNVNVPRVPEAVMEKVGGHDLPGPTFRKLSDEIAYLKLSSVKASDAADYIEAAAGTKGLIIDIRNYPSEFVVFALGSLLAREPVEFARFTVADVTNPGSFHFTEPITLRPQPPTYMGRIVILVDENSQSQSEYTAMAFRAVTGATVVGSTTAGADGNISPLPLPGGLRTMISGIGVFYPDKRPTQRVGIVGDVHASPTMEGILAGRDEVLETAIRVILGDGVPASQVEKMIRPE